MNSLSISLVIPAYNEEAYLPKTLHSVSQLFRKPDEILMVDGGSTDKTRSVARSFGVRVLIVHQRGIGLARQIGLERARGDIVAYTDADTLVPPKWLTTIEQTLMRSGVVGMYGSFQVSDGPMPYRFLTNYVNPTYISLSHMLGVPGQNMAVYRKVALAVGGFPDDFLSVEDIEMIRRLKTVGIVVYRKDNVVVSSGRRGREGFSMIPRKVGGMLRYYITRNANRFFFPDIR